jgi:hypothetical protein
MKRLGREAERGSLGSDPDRAAGRAGAGGSTDHRASPTMGYTRPRRVHADELGDTFAKTWSTGSGAARQPRPVPHGWPIGPDAEQVENSSSGVDGARAGRSATIVQAERRRPAALVLRRGLVPGAVVELDAAEPAAGRLRIRRRRREVDRRRAAAGLFVRPTAVGGAS